MSKFIKNTSLDFTVLMFLPLRRAAKVTYLLINHLGHAGNIIVVSDTQTKGLWPPTLSNQLQMSVVVLFKTELIVFPGSDCVIWYLKRLNPVASGGTLGY